MYQKWFVAGPNSLKIFLSGIILDGDEKRSERKKIGDLS
jgi:hypothetical protein